MCAYAVPPTLLLLGFQEEEVQQVQVQLSGSKQQLNLVQDRLNSSGASQPQAPFPSGVDTNSHAQPPATGQEYGQDHDHGYQGSQAYPGDQDADMEFEPPGSTGGPERDPSFDPAGMARPGAGPEAREGVQRSEGQDQGQGDLYSPGLSAQPSGLYMSEPDVHGRLRVDHVLSITRSSTFGVQTGQCSL